MAACVSARLEGRCLPLLVVFAVGFVEIWFAVPTGLALGLPWPVVWCLTASGSLVSTTIVAFGGDALGTG